MADSVLINYETVSNPDMLATIIRGIQDELQLAAITVNELIVDHSTLVQSRDALLVNASSLGSCMLSGQSVFVAAAYQSPVSGALDASTFTSTAMAQAGPGQLTASKVITTDVAGGLEIASNPELLRVTLERMGTQMSLVRNTVAELITDHATQASAQASLMAGASSMGSCYLSYQVLVQASSIIEDPCPSQFDASTFKSSMWTQAVPAAFGTGSVITAMVDQGE